LEVTCYGKGSWILILIVRSDAKPLKRINGGGHETLKVLAGLKEILEYDKNAWS
jgi:hypothetical protein